MNETLTMPEPLSIYELHSPAEKRAHAAKVAAFRDARQREEAAQRRKEDAAEAAANAPLDDDSYFQLALKRQQEQKAKEAQREAERQQQQQAEADYLNSLPASAEVSERSEYLFLSKLAAWIAKGYTVTEESVRYWAPGFYSVVLASPVTAKGGAK